MGLTITTPTVLPAAYLSMAKSHMRVSGSTDDALITVYMNAAINDAEEYTGRAVFDTVYKYTLMDFPSGAEIVLPRSPVSAVASIKYYDEDGVLQTFGTGNYSVNINDQMRGSIYLDEDADWPAVQEDNPEAVEIAFTAGYGSAYTDIPQAFAFGILLYAGHVYDFRDGDATDKLQKIRERIFHPFKANFYA